MDRISINQHLETYWIELYRHWTPVFLYILFLDGYPSLILPTVHIIIETFSIHAVSASWDLQVNKKAEWRSPPPPYIYTYVLLVCLFASIYRIHKRPDGLADRVPNLMICGGHWTTYSRFKPWITDSDSRESLT